MGRVSAMSLAILTVFAWASQAARPEVLVSRGVYSPFFRDEGEKDQEVGPLKVDRFPVTNRDFLKFVKTHPEWSKSRIKAIWAGQGYLEHWMADLSFREELLDQPVTNVSWFAARAYCASENKRLLRIAEWEYVSDAQSAENLARVLDWYGRANSLAGVHRLKGDSRGIVGMHGLIWEWVEDFSSAIVSSDSRSTNETSASMFCGSGSLKAKDPAAYATFMRFAHRSSLRGSSVGRSLGFRCAHY